MRRQRTGPAEGLGDVLDGKTDLGIDGNLGNMDIGLLAQREIVDRKADRSGAGRRRGRVCEPLLDGSFVQVEVLSIGRVGSGRLGCLYVVGCCRVRFDLGLNHECRCLRYLEAGAQAA